MVVAAGCAASEKQPADGDGAVYAGSMCAYGHALSGVTYDVSKSRFAFGSKPVRQDDRTLVRWSGSDGALAIFAGGEVLTSLNAGAPEMQLAEFSDDSETLEHHVTDYFVSLGVEACQIADAGVLGRGTGTATTDGTITFTPLPSAVGLSRGVEGISVSDSYASAIFVVGDLTTEESLFWPTIPADVVSEALALRDRLNDPSKLADYKTLLPDAARGDGTVMIHHSGSGSDEQFRAVAVYETSLTPPPNAPPEFYETRDFDADGNPVAGWEGGSK